MKKIFFLLIITSLSILTANSQCFRNKVNCSYGCGRHIDQNNDGYCDLTTFTEELLHKIQHCKDSVAQAEQKKNNQTANADSLSKTKSNKKEIKENKTIKSQPENKVQSPITTAASTDTTSKAETTSTIVNQMAVKMPESKPYDLILVSLITIGLYLSTLCLSVFGLIKKVNHRRIWNVLLLLTFLISCLFGFFLVIQINYNFILDWFKTILYWHVEIGIAMTLISIFHIWWHLRYFKNIFKKSSQS